MTETATDRRDHRLRAMLAGCLKMPGALEAVDDVLAQVDSGEMTASVAIELVFNAQLRAAQQPSLARLPCAPRDTAGRQDAGAV